jgi:NCAIR mutase (PurE)-related protein
MTMRERLQSVLAELREAGASERAILSELAACLNRSGEHSVPLPEARVDMDRSRRCGHPEVIYGPGKPSAALCEIIARQSEAGQDVLATRVSPEQAEAALRAHPDIVWNEQACTLRLMSASEQVDAGRVVVITAGTSDRPVAEEAVETLAWMRVGRELIVDVGVAGPWRMLEQLQRLEAADAAIVVAGMEGALPSVVGGWCGCPVFAVPTSVGYGAAFGGVAALLGMLNSCAANVAVVNIDAGFKAGYLAGLVARAAASA